MSSAVPQSSAGADSGRRSQTRGDGAFAALPAPSRAGGGGGRGRAAAGATPPEEAGPRLEPRPAARFPAASLELTLTLTWLRQKRIKAYVR